MELQRQLTAIGECLGIGGEEIQPEEADAMMLELEQLINRKHEG